MFQTNKLYTLLLVILIAAVSFITIPDAALAAEKGGLYLVSTGVGDPDNMTVRAHKIISKASIVFARKGASERMPELLAGKEIHDAGHGMFWNNGNKGNRPKAEIAAQEDATRRIIRTGVAAGKTVVILDNGDPAIYGPHTGYLKEFSDLNPEVVPGISSFNAANAALKTGVTGGSSRAVILTAATQTPGEKTGDTLARLAESRSTMVFFMDRNLAEAVKQLKTHYAGTTPIAIVSEAGSAKKQAVLKATLDTVVERTGNGKLPFQHLIYVGDFLQ